MKLTASFHLEFIRTTNKHVEYVARLYELRLTPNRQVVICIAIKCCQTPLETSSLTDPTQTKRRKLSFRICYLVRWTLPQLLLEEKRLRMTNLFYALVFYYCLLAFDSIISSIKEKNFLYPRYQRNTHFWNKVFANNKKSMSSICILSEGSFLFATNV